MSIYEIRESLYSKYPTLIKDKSADLNKNGIIEDNEKLIDADGDGTIGSGFDFMDFIGRNSAQIEKEIVDNAYQTTLLEFINPEQPESTRMMAGFALGYLKDDRAIPILIKQLNNPKDIIWMTAEKALSMFGMNALDELAKGLVFACEGNNNDLKVRISYLISKLGETAIPAIFKMLQHGDSDVRFAIQGVAVSFGKNIIPKLADETLKNANLDLRMSAIFIFRDLNYKSAIPTLKILIETDKNPKVQEAAKIVMEKLEKEGK